MSVGRRRVEVRMQVERPVIQAPRSKNCGILNCLSVSSGVCADIPKFRKSDNGHSACDTKPPAWIKQIGTFFFLYSRGLKGEAYGLWSGRWKMAVPAQLSVPLQGGDRTTELAVLTHSVNKHSCSHNGP